MELRDIEIFLTLADELHFGRTADRLHISVSRVSHVIRSQEVALGARLFDRTSRRVVLTPVGETLKAGLRPAYDALQRAIADAAALAQRSTETITIGAMGAQIHDLEPVLRAFRDLHPLADVRFREVFFTDPFEQLRQREVDLVTAWLPVHDEDLGVACVLREEPLNLLVPSDHPLASRSAVSIEDLADLAVPAIRGPGEWLATLVPAVTPSGREIRRAHEVTTYSEVLALVAAGEAVCPVPDEGRRYYPWPGVSYVPFSDAEPVRWALIARRDRMRPIVDDFVRIARSVSAVGHEGVSSL
ncbi:LysR family transcriptional regulator [Leifsonia sp. RAF41]|uniref:LysR family transcriptional regulator n=1 Tax=Leifsonia sp. RAF41 TaxID=3233056 RepID=UPI003F943249